jgi:hypothetical protein
MASVYNVNANQELLIFVPPFKPLLQFLISVEILFTFSSQTHRTSQPKLPTWVSAPEPVGLLKSGRYFAPGRSAGVHFRVRSLDALAFNRCCVIRRMRRVQKRLKGLKTLLILQTIFVFVSAFHHLHVAFRSGCISNDELFDVAGALSALVSHVNDEAG